MPNRSSLLILALAIAAGACTAAKDSNPSGSAGTTGAGGAGGSGGGGGDPGCALISSYTVIESFGLNPMINTIFLSPPNLFRYERQSFLTDAGEMSCTPPFPCSDASRIDVAELEAAVANADVQTVLAQANPTFFGETLVADGPSFNFSRGEGGGSFEVGVECNVPSATCTPMPPGVKALVDLLRMLIAQGLADPACDPFDS